jgi:hypothetical protein
MKMGPLLPSSRNPPKKIGSFHCKNNVLSHLKTPWTIQHLPSNRFPLHTFFHFKDNVVPSNCWWDRVKVQVARRKGRMSEKILKMCRRGDCWEKKVLPTLRRVPKVSVTQTRVLSTTRLRRSLVPVILWNSQSLQICVR